jgi:hypothetical protein
VSIKPATAAVTPVTSPRDAFGHKAPKLAALLGLSSEASVLVIGDDWRDWREDLERYFPATVRPRSVIELESILPSGSVYDLILLSFRHGLGSSLSTPQLLEQLRNKLSPSGSLFLVAENRLALARIARNPLSLIASGRTTAPSCRFRLWRAGFERVEEFLPLPRLWTAEEFVSSRHGEAALPADTPAIEVALNRIGLLSILHDGCAYIASSRNAGTRTILQRIARHLTPEAESEQSLVLERFDLRDRGALVLMVRATATGRRIVCRITTGEETDRSVRLNAEWIARVRESPSVSAAVKQFIPTPLGSFPMRAGAGYMEELIAGTIAWKLARNSRLDFALQESMGDFIHRFNRDTAVTVRVDQIVFADLLKSAHVLSMDQETLRLVAALENQLRNRLLGTDRWLVWAHGDFGYGNAIADPRTAALRGIIDWDQGRIDLAGIDLLNFLIFREHGRAGGALIASFKSIADRVVTQGFRGVDARLDYEDTFPLGQQGRLDALACVALRITQRAAIYPALFASSRAETHSILRWACEALGQ